MRKLFCILLMGTLFSGLGFSSVSAEGFTDIHKGSSFYEEMMYLYNEEIIKGFEDGEFKPDRAVSRAQAAIMIGRILDYSDEPRESTFSDVGKTTTGSGFIQTAYENGIISGFGDNTFRPDEPVTRGQMAIMIARAFEIKDEAIVPFNDVSIHMKAYRSIRQIISFGVTEGYPDGSFKPDAELSRSQFSAFLARAVSDDFRLKVDACGYDPESRVNPDRQTVNCLITKAALEFDDVVPPEVVKSIASVESSGWKQFDSNGEPIISDDGGIGIMQLTSPYEVDVNEERLKYDLTYNIEAGIRTLASKYKSSSLPTIGNQNPMNLENWYFAIMGYNGAVAVNSPFYKETGNHNFNSYQMKVYRDMEDNGVVTPQIFQIPMTVDDFHYGDDTDWDIVFKKDHYNFYADYTPSRHYFKPDDLVVHVGDTLRNDATTKSTGTKLQSAEKLKIIAAPEYDLTPNSTNEFVWYPVEVVRTGQKGYVASYNVRELP
ncbi:S-layer homology domain-containing protein [Bacillus sp. MCCB 382]|uniref:S-layer homology domain-containing protein n=1 Tax=Bacillus sp. MCCB 382 TaxID=2860197 RepID=UPI001C57CF7C|nr:S-layer homology domain-containing protein [Bacillus sp. MCCB 382]